MTAPTGAVAAGDFGEWKVYARPPGQSPVDVTWFRDAPVSIGDWSDADPFGPRSATMTFPAVTIFDRLGHGELFWLTKHVDIDLVYIGTLPADYPYDSYVWEGFAEAFDYSSGGIKVTLKGALYELDGPLAKPEYPPAPLPYEYAIARQWDARPSMRTSRPRVEWPEWWETTYEADASAPAWLVPMGVADGDAWSGLVTRRTGSWEPSLTSYIQTLLAGMYTERGRWTLDLLAGRKPVLTHRDFRYEVDDACVVLSAVSPGLKYQLTQDWSQSMNAVYGQGTSLQGSGYSGMQVLGDGSRTVYKPLAAMRQVEPITDGNGWLEPHRMLKETRIELPEGLSQTEARRVALAHLTHFSDPGLTGTITLTADVRLGSGDILPRSLIRSGMSVQFAGVFGSEAGVMLHIASVDRKPGPGEVILTVDSKYRDQQTIDEVRVRGRDSLSIVRQLIGGQYEPPIPDQLVPWNYAEGSGYIPSSEKLSAQRLFEGMPGDLQFPYESWTMDRPPRSAAYKDCYIRVGPASGTDTADNWARNPSRDASAGSGFGFGIPIRMAQQGAIRLIQLAAYNADGEVFPVAFHFSLYYSPNVNVQSMPRIPVAQSGLWGPGAGFVVDTDTVQHYPFHDNAWERFNADGTQRSTEVAVNVETAGLVRGWGTGAAKAGYWPGTSVSDSPTGLLVDEGQFSFNPYTEAGFENTINPYSTIQNSPAAGFLYAMVYCEDQGAEPVYFAGRMFRVEPGASV